MSAPSFDGLVERLRETRHIVAAGPRFVTLEIEGQQVEIFRLSVGSEDWAALTAGLGRAAPSRHDGMGALVRCRDGWALRLTLPVAEVSAETFLETILRLALEAIDLRRAEPATHDSAVLAMWAG